MIVRRSLAVLLAGWLLIALSVTFLLWRINSTLLSPEYVKNALSEAGLYDFIYDERLTSILENTLNNSPSLSNEGLEELRFLPKQDAPTLVGFVHDVVPREEFQARIELTIDEAMPWFTGDRDEVKIELKLNERIDAVPDAFGRRIAELELGRRVSEDFLAPKLAKTLNGIDAGTLGLAITPERSREIAEAIAPGDWLESQAVNAVQEIAVWATKENDTFRVVVHYAERIPHATTIIKEVLDESDVEEYLFNTVIAPEVTRALGQSIPLPLDVFITDAEVIWAIEKVAPIPWVREQRNQIIDSLSGFLSGETDELLYVVDMSERREATVNTVAELGEQKLLELADSFPQCASESDSALAFEQIKRGQLPSCSGNQMREAISSLIATVSGLVNQQVGDHLPETIIINEQFLQRTVGNEIVAQLKEVRNLIREGFVFTDEDFVKEITYPGSGITTRDIDLLRDILSSEYMLTEQDLLDRVGPAIGSKELFETARQNFGRIRALWWAVFILPALLIVTIFFLGGRTWSGRLAWATGTLAVIAAILWLGTWQGWERIGSEEVRRALAQGALQTDAQFRPTMDEASVRILGVVEKWVERYTSASRGTSIGSLFLFLMAISWHYSGGSTRMKRVGETLTGTATILGKISAPGKTKPGSRQWPMGRVGKKITRHFPEWERQFKSVIAHQSLTLPKWAKRWTKPKSLPGLKKSNPHVESRHKPATPAKNKGRSNVDLLAETYVAKHPDDNEPDHEGSSEDDQPRQL